jgi:hypothetical protein
LPLNASTAWFAHRPSCTPGPSDPKTGRKELRRWMSLYPELCEIFVPLRSSGTNRLLCFPSGRCPPRHFRWCCDIWSRPAVNHGRPWL